MKVRLTKYDKCNVITLLSNNSEHLGGIVYEENKDRAESDYLSLATEQNTYGDGALVELFNYFSSVRPK